MMVFAIFPSEFSIVRIVFESSALMKVHAYPATKIPAANVPSLKPGCAYTYHLGEFTCTADVRASKVVSSGVMEAPSIKDAPDEDHFGYVFTGYLDIPSDGIWNFAVRSDDGGLLEIDGKVVFRHVQHWLVPEIVPAHDDAYNGIFISERIFWGKVRAAEFVDDYAADTWKAIAGSVEKIQELEK